MNSVSILNVGEGDTTLSFDKKNPQERERAATIVTDMLKRGYALLVQVGKRDGEPIYKRVKQFDPKRCEYIIAGGPDEQVDIGAESKPGRKKKSTRRIPADSTKGVSVPRTAGGCPPMEQLNRFDKFSPLRNRLRGLSTAVGEWAGIPIPIEGESLVVEPSYPLAGVFAKDDSPDEDDASIRNIFWSRRHRRNIIVWEENGRVKKYFVPGAGSLDIQFHTLACSVAWGLEQESKALQTLAGLLRHHAFKSYLLTGSFLETSPRSRLTYMFRKLRPTVVLDAKDQSADSTRVLCTLCMHPIGYYDNSWAGAMTPTDDVIAHLMLMRGDEPMLWRRCNQHNPQRPESGLH